MYVRDFAQHCTLCSFFSLSAIQTEEMKVKKSIKDAAKKGQTDVCKILAKEVVQSRKAVGKLYASKAQMNSVLMQMQHQLCELLKSAWERITFLYFYTAMLRMSGAIGKSTEVMHSMQELIKLPEIRDSMMELSREMSKVAICT